MLSSEAAIAQFVQRECLPTQYIEQVQTYFLAPLERCLASAGPGPVVLGIHGAQGSGKSTLASCYQWYLQHCRGLRSAVLSLDDFYLPPEARQVLARDVHPLLATRGVPGSHDVALARACITSIKAGRDTLLPRFDKARDRPFPSCQWPESGDLDVLIFEGWCLGVPPQNEAQLLAPVNALEREEDADGRWRRWVNQRLAQDYPALFAEVDYLLMLQAPSFDCVARWRIEQEEGLRQRRAGEVGTHFMSEAEIVRFISHYERLSRHGLVTVPALADARVALNDNRTAHRLQMQGEGE